MGPHHLTWRISGCNTSHPCPPLVGSWRLESQSSSPSVPGEGPSPGSCSRPLPRVPRFPRPHGHEEPRELLLHERRPAGPVQLVGRHFTGGWGQELSPGAGKSQQQPPCCPSEPLRTHMPFDPAVPPEGTVEMWRKLCAGACVILSFNGNDLRVQGHGSLRASPPAGVGVRGAAQCSLTRGGLQGAGSGEQAVGRGGRAALCSAIPFGGKY